MNETPASTTQGHNAPDEQAVGLQTDSRAQLSRTKIVWGSLVLSMTVVGGLLMVLDTTPHRSRALPAAVERAKTTTGIETLFETSAELSQTRWTGIVVHHSGDPSGSAEVIAEQHESQGLQGLGYHFVIGNGRGAADGSINGGYRWDAQLPGAHAIGPDAAEHNRHSIGICLVGDGNQKAFTDQQLASLIALVERLQDEFGIPEDAVFLHTDIAPTASPGRLFPASAFRAKLRTRG